MPGFDLTLKIPDLPQWLLPDPNGASIEVDTSAPFVVTWTPTDESIIVQLYQPDLNDGTFEGYLVFCRYPGTAGQATIPVEAMSELKTSATADLSVSHATMQEVALGSRVLWTWGRNSTSRTVNVK